MTNDIVTRLREKYSGQLPICLEAANEIEVLRSDLASCRDDLNYWYNRCTTAKATNE